MSNPAETADGRQTRAETFGLVSLLIGIALLGLFAILVFDVVCEETRWAFFTRIHIERICGDGQEGECVKRIPGRIVAKDGRHLDVAYSDNRRVQPVRLNRGRPVPATDERVTLEEWHGRVISVVTRQEQRLQTDDWPAPGHDARNAALAWGAFLSLIALLAGMVIGLTAQSGAEVAEQAGADDALSSP